MSTDHIAQIKRAELLSSIGAGVLGAGIGLLLANVLAGYAAPILVLGLVAHSAGMTKKHRLERNHETARVWWAEALYWFCWLGLAALLVFILVRLI